MRTMGHAAGARKIIHRQFQACFQSNFFIVFLYYFRLKFTNAWRHDYHVIISETITG
jgi:hypothetical protein